MTDQRASNPILYDGEARILEIRADHPALADTMVVSGGTRVPLAQIVGIIRNEWHREGLSVKIALEDCAQLRAELNERSAVNQAEVYRRAAWRRERGSAGTWHLKCRTEDGGAVVGAISLHPRGYEWQAGTPDALIATGYTTWRNDAQRAVRKALREAAHVE